jgi:hypothetical protein
MRVRAVAFVGIMFVAGHVLAQTAPRAVQPPQTPFPAPTPPTAAAPPAPAPAAPPAPRREGQPINVRVELTITEDGGEAPVIKKTVSAVVGDGYMGYVREQGVSDKVTPTPGPPLDRLVAPLNLDALPTILPNGKIRVQCTIQYSANQRTANERRNITDIKQNLTLILESGKSLVVSQATDPLSERQVTVEVKATILR